MTTQNHQRVTLIFGALAAISGIVALFTYIENKKINALKKKVLESELEIKQLQKDKLSKT